MDFQIYAAGSGDAEGADSFQEFDDSIVALLIAEISIGQDRSELVIDLLLDAAIHLSCIAIRILDIKRSYDQSPVLIGIVKGRSFREGRKDGCLQNVEVRR